MIEEDIIEWIAGDLRVELFKNFGPYPFLFSTFKNMSEHEGLLVLRCIKRGNSFSGSYDIIRVVMLIENDKVKIIYNDNIKYYLDLADPNIVKNILTNLEKNLRIIWTIIK